MVKVIVTRELNKEIFKTFSLVEAKNIIYSLRVLEEQPKKGKLVGVVDKTVIKELKHGKYRFYCVTDGHMLHFGTTEELTHLLIKFVRMSDKKEQQKTINEIKEILKKIGF